MSFQQEARLMRAVEARFKYCTLIWMFHSGELNTKINLMGERPLRSVHKDYNNSFNDLFKKDKSTSHRNTQTLAINLWRKVRKIFCNTIMSDIFKNRVLNYNLRSQTVFFRNTVNTTKFSLNSLRYFTALKYLKKNT